MSETGSTQNDKKRKELENYISDKFKQEMEEKRKRVDTNKYSVYSGGQNYNSSLLYRNLTSENDRPMESNRSGKQMKEENIM